jgi:hypothetical protein
MEGHAVFNLAGIANHAAAGAFCPESVQKLPLPYTSPSSLRPLRRTVFSEKHGFALVDIAFNFRKFVTQVGNRSDLQHRNTPLSIDIFSE